jgi:carbon-monoxide dehydrogenase medium subunit
LNPDELVKEIQIPAMPAGSHGVYFKLSPRSKMDLAVVGVGAVVSGDEDSVADARIALGAVAPTPIRCKKAEDILKGGKVDEKRIEEAGQSAADASKPIDDHRASAEYRKMMVDVLVKRAIRQALAN